MDNRAAILSAMAGALAVALAGSPLGAAADPLGSPAMTPPLSANSNPMNFDAGPLGKIYVTGAVTGLALAQSEHSPYDRSDLADLSNGQVFIQTTSGPLQFFIEAGVYSFPDLGAPYVHASSNTTNTFSAIPVAYVKLQPTSAISVQIGKLPTLIGSELAFTFQNMNIERGLLWNQEPVVSDGVQVNYAKGPLTVSLSVNDGFYSNRYNWLSGLVSYAINPKDTVTIDGGASLSHDSRATAATPLFQNNGGILDLSWTHTQGAWMINPYFQYTRADSIEASGARYAGGDTYSGAILAKYNFNPRWSLAGRVEYIASSSADCLVDSETCAPTNLLYGASSKAVSATLTPTYQKGIFFVRAEASYVGIIDGGPGAGFGQYGAARSQFRGLVETGVLF